MTSIRLLTTLTLALLIGGSASAQDKGTLNPKPLPPLANPEDPRLPAKELFGRRDNPASRSRPGIGGARWAR